MELTGTHVRYLLTIHHLSQARLEVSSKDIARCLEVSRASVTSMMGVLMEKQLITKEHYGKVHLTGLGNRLAHALSRQAEAFAAQLPAQLGLSAEESWKAACAAVSQLPARCYAPACLPERISA